MGEVYLAEDPRLDRKVALKCPSHEWLTQPDARERLHREARAAARLKHPNIAAVYDVLDVDDRPYIVMEYVEGESLSARLRRGRLPVEHAVQIALQMAEAVADAHANGVLHRDLKPGNVCLTRDGRVKVLDFGLAKMRPVHADPASPPSIESSLTEAGQLLGTPGYAAPEQLTGKTADQRSDVFALGVILFEMVTGRLPFSGADPMSLALATVTEPAPSVCMLTPAAPPELAAAVAHALEKNPKERFHSAARFATELRRIAASLGERPTLAVEEAWTAANPPAHAPTVRLSTRLAAGVLAGLLVIAGIILAMQWVTERRPASAPAPVVAVLPFAAPENDGELAALAVGLADTLTSDLGGVEGLVVVPRSSTLRYGGRDAVSRAARGEGASHVIQGALSRSGADVSLDVSLLAADGRVVLQRRYTGRPAAVPGLEQLARRDVVTAMRGPLSARPSSDTGGTLDAQAFEHYSQARQLLDRGDIPENLTRAIALLLSATERDPQLAPAYASLGEAYWAQYRLTKEPALTISARDALIRAQTLQPNLPQVTYLLGLLYRNTGRTDEAIRELERAIAQNPGNDSAHRQLGMILFDQGKVDAAMDELAKAIAIRSDYPGGHLTLATAAYRQGRFSEAEGAYRRVTELQPESPAGYQGLAEVYHAVERWPEAEKHYQTAIRLGAGARARVNLATLYLDTGRYRDAIDTYTLVAKDVPGDVNYWRLLADAHRDLGERTPAREAYTRGVAAGEQALKVNAKDARTLASLAVCEANLGDHARAREHARQALDLSPRDSDVLYRASVVSALAGDRTEAIAYLGRAIAAGFSAKRVARDRAFASVNQSSDFRKLVTPGT